MNADRHVVLITIINLLLFLILCSCKDVSILTNETLYTSQEPISGQLIRFDYSAPHNILLGDNCAASIIYTDSKNISHNIIPLKKGTVGFYFELYVPDSVSGALMTIVDAGNELIDNNNGQAYYQEFYQSQGHRFNNSSISKAALLSSRWANIDFRCSTSRSDILELYKADFQNSPVVQETYGSQYLNYLRFLHLEEKGKVKEFLFEQAVKFQSRPKDQNRLIYASTILGWLKNTTEKASVDSLIRVNFPHGKSAQDLFFDNNLLAASASIQEIDQYIERYSDQFGDHFSSKLFTTILPSLISIGDTISIKAYESRVTDRKALLPAYRRVIQHQLDKDGVSTHELASTNYCISQGFKLFSQGENSVDSSDYWKMSTLYSEALIKMGLTEKYLTNQNSLLNRHMLNTEQIEEYANAIEQLVSRDSADQFIRLQLSYPVYSVDLFNQLKRLNEGSLADIEHYALFEREYKIKVRQKLQDELMLSFGTTIAPGFDLVNLEGNRVALSDYIGKVVVIDFWATWCGPCKASFPSMKELTKEYKDEDIVFLFLDVRESKPSDVVKSQIREFISENGYSDFNIPIDSDNSTADKYGVNVLPTKYVIDKNGLLAARNIGGSHDELKFEIEMAYTISTKLKN